MKLGCCAGIDKASLVHEAGFDYLECTVVSLEPEGNETDFQAILKQFKKSDIPVEVFNVFLPKDLKIVGDSVDQQRIINYVESALARVKQVGAEIVVFGSGGARRIPDNFSSTKAREQIILFLNIVADVADKLGITVVIEPLNQKECNIINTVTEAVEYAKQVNRPSIKALADFYHMDQDGESLENVINNKNWIYHLHVADTERVPPGQGEYPYAKMLEAIEGVASPRISVECKWNDFDKEVFDVVEFLKNYIN